jgi:hypothetical protein
VTWQADRAYDRLTQQDAWQYGRMTGGVRLGDVAHTWANKRPTRGMFSLVEKGATWPNPGLPRGTPSLVYGFNVKNFG